MSKAVVFSEFGDADVLRVIERDRPALTGDQVRVRVKAAGVQPFDTRYRAGMFGDYVPAEFPQGLGGEFAGIVDEVGADVDTLGPGVEVLGFVWAAGYAEEVVVPASDVVPKPAGMSWEEAGALSASGQTAHTALEELHVGKDDTLLLHASAGGVGSFAVQLAVHAGATVIGTASERNHDYLRSLGATPVSYGAGLAQRVAALVPRGVDVALDAHGGDEAIQVSLELVDDRSRIGTLTAYSAVSQYGIKLIGTQRSQERLARLTDLYEHGALRVCVHEVFPLDRAADAHRVVETGHVRGKVVLSVA